MDLNWSIGQRGGWCTETSLHVYDSSKQDVKTATPALAPAHMQGLS